MDEWMAIARAWMASEWEQSPDVEEQAKLRRRVVAYVEQINRTANDALIRRTSICDCSCGRDSCEEEDGVVRDEPV